MNRHLKWWLLGFLMAGVGVTLIWSDYRGLGMFFAWIGWGIAAYGIGGGLLERIRQSRKK